MTVAFLERVQRSLDWLRRADPTGERVFGARRHGYRLHPPLDERALVTFEAAHAVRLPEDYRAFVSRVGNGGAGPLCGLFRLGEMDHGAGVARWKPGQTVGSPSVPFPHEERWNLPARELESLQKASGHELRKRYWLPVDGALPLAHEGYGLRQWLVVTGPEAGKVWHDGTTDFEGWSPLLGELGESLSFEAWYSGWLDRTLDSVLGR